MWTGRKSTRWGIGMERVRIGTRIMTAIRLSREAEYFTVRSAGVLFTV